MEKYELNKRLLYMSSFFKEVGKVKPSISLFKAEDLCVVL